MTEEITYSNIGGLTREVKETGWGIGEWLDEPDIFSFERKGFKCFGNRTVGWDGENNEHLFGGWWCGYIQIPPGHPWHGKEFDECSDLDCHGGVTFCEKDKETGNLVIGFDCGHSWDISPSQEKFMKLMKETSEHKHLYQYEDVMKKKYPNCAMFNKVYRNIDYVVEQCKSMADQAFEAQQSKSHPDSP